MMNGDFLTRCLSSALVVTLVLPTQAHAQIACQFTIPPSDPVHSINSRQGLTFYILDQNGDPAQNCALKLTPIVVADSYGHVESQHSGTHPAGSFAPSTCNSGSGFDCNVIYTAPQPSTQVRMRLSPDLVADPDGRCNDAFQTPINTSDFGMCVQIDGLVLLAQTTPDTLIGARPAHPVNHYGKPASNAAINSLAAGYFAMNGGIEKLHVNDMSLVKGGLLDINHNWNRPHALHRAGEDVDIRRPIKQARRIFILQTVAKRDFPLYYISEPPPPGDDTTHYHLRLR